jgi:hypothetical protein
MIVVQHPVGVTKNSRFGQGTFAASLERALLAGHGGILLALNAF